MHHRGTEGAEKGLRDLFVSQFVLYTARSVHVPKRGIAQK